MVSITSSCPGGPTESQTIGQYTNHTHCRICGDIVSHVNVGQSLYICPNFTENPEYMYAHFDPPMNHSLTHLVRDVSIYYGLLLHIMMFNQKTYLFENYYMPAPKLFFSAKDIHPDGQLPIGHQALTAAIKASHKTLLKAI